MSEVKQKCCGVVLYRGWPHSCAKTPKVERDGKWYCGIHDPVAKKEKDIKRNAKWERKWAQEKIDRENQANAMKQKDHRDSCFPDLLEALKDAYPYIDNPHLRLRIGDVIAKAEGIVK